MGTHRNAQKVHKTWSHLHGVNGASQPGIAAGFPFTPDLDVLYFVDRHLLPVPMPSIQQQGQTTGVPTMHRHATFD